MFRKLRMMCYLAPILVLILGGVAYYQFSQLAQRPVQPSSDPFFVLARGTSSQMLAELLHEKGMISKMEQCVLPYFMRVNPQFSQFKAGVYSLDNLTTLGDVLNHFNSGKEVQLNVQFIEGRTFKNWREQLAKAPYLNQTLSNKTEAEIAQLLGISQSKLEGWLAPDTYSYVPYSDDVALLKRALQKQQNDLADAWQNRAENLPLANPYEMLILASIVEKETALANERPQVASVFINRLNNNWKLQTDPTVIYGMGERYDGNIRKKDLLEPTPYNTYVIDGLPPTPIAMPSKASIMAVAQPDETPYFYFVADGTGGHKFSRTLAEHNKAVREWIQIERQKKSEKK